MMDILAPEGVTIDINIYATSPSTGMSAAIKLGGMKGLNLFEGERSAEALLARFPPVVDDWRLMTTAEIKDYNEEQEPTDDEDDDY
jgi:hypothetical protein